MVVYIGLLEGGNVRDSGNRMPGVTVVLPLVPYATLREVLVEGCEPGGVCACTPAAARSTTSALVAEEVCMVYGPVNTKG